MRPAKAWELLFMILDWRGRMHIGVRPKTKMHISTYPLRLLLAFSLAFSTVNHAFADAPATEFFVVNSAKLIALAPDDTNLDALSSDQLSKISVIRGSYTGGLSMIAMSDRLRIDARFTSAFSKGKEPISYNICASGNPGTWDICSEQGTAIKTGKQFVTKNWRTRPIAVVLRFLDLKR